MLEVVGNPVAVNTDKALRRIAMDREWTIEVFRNPVTLRDRLPQLRAPGLNPAGALAAAVGVAGIAVATWWMTKSQREGAGR
jgi:hypothetical protein